MSYTKGPLEAVKNGFGQQVLIRCEAHPGINIALCNDHSLDSLPLETQEANAREFVRRWNAFEEDGLVTELLEACKKMMKAWIQPTARSMDQLRTDMDKAYKKANAAISTAEQEG